MPSIVIDFINGKLVGLPIGDVNGIAGLDSGGKVPSSQLPASVVGAMNYKGTWNASTNSPALASGVGTQGYYYKISVAGTTSIDGNTIWDVGDFIAYDGTTWDKFEGNIGTFTTNYIPRAISTGTLGNSVIQDNGTGRLGFNTAPHAQHAFHFEYASAGYNIAEFHSLDQYSFFAIDNTNTGTPSVTAIQFNEFGIQKWQIGKGPRDGSNDFNIYYTPNDAIRIKVLASNGNIGLGGNWWSVTPTAYLHLFAGTASASTAPLKFSLFGSVLLTTPEIGAMETDSTGNLYFTNSTPTRNRLPTVADNLTAFAVGGLVLAVSTKTAAYTITSSDYTILADMTAGAYSITLPVSPSTGMVVNIKKKTSDANTLTISRNGKNIEGSAADLTTAATNFPNFTLTYDGISSWWII